MSLYAKHHHECPTCRCDAPIEQPAASEAGAFTARGIHELNLTVISLAEQGYRIIAVIDTQNGDYHVVAQKGGCRG